MDETNIDDVFTELESQGSAALLRLAPNPLDRLYAPSDISLITGLKPRQIARLSARNLIVEDQFAPGNRPRYKCGKIFLFHTWKILRTGNTDGTRPYSYHRAVTLLRRITKFLTPYHGRFADTRLLIEANAGRRRPKILLIQHGEARFEEGDDDWWVINLHTIVEEIAQWCLKQEDTTGVA